jgi:hypothetical protein
MATPSRPHEVIGWNILAGVLYGTVKSGRSSALYTITSDRAAGKDVCNCPAGQHGRDCDHLPAFRDYVVNDPRAVALRYALEAFALDARRSA